MSLLTCPNIASVADVDGDGKNEVLVAPSMEYGVDADDKYIRTGYALMCYQGK
jgi:hypothetical protein